MEFDIEAIKQRWLEKMHLECDPLTYDCEAVHSSADYILCQILEEFGLKEIVELYNSYPKWYA